MTIGNRRSHHRPVNRSRLGPLFALVLAVIMVGAGCGGEEGPSLVDIDAASDGRENTASDSDSSSPSPDPTASAEDPTSEGATVAPAEPPTRVFDLDAPALRLRPEVIQRFTHDRAAFTQGLLFHEGRLYESRGLYEQSALTEIDPTTGDVLRRVDVDDDYFAEGLAHVDDRLIQLTWRAGLALVYDRNTFELVDQFSYSGEGWGLCFDGESLWMSDGTDTLTRRDAQTFEALDRVRVTLDGSPLDQLNELECIDGTVWANVWLTDLIVEIHPPSGTVVSLVDAAGLLSEDERNAGADVLNGIAHDPDRDAIIITGKNWPAMFEVEFRPCDGVC